MKTPLSAIPRGLFASAFISAALAVPVLRAADGPLGVAKPAVNAPVTVTDSGGAWTLDNGLVKATISKGNGRLTALVFHGINTMAGGGYWEQSPAGAANSLTIDPAKNGGERAEVSVKGAPGRGIDIELRYALARRQRNLRLRDLYPPGGQRRGWLWRKPLHHQAQP